MNLHRIIFLGCLFLLLALTSSACYRPFSSALTPLPQQGNTTTNVGNDSISDNSASPSIPTAPPIPTLNPVAPIYTPTPDVPHVLPTERAMPDQYTIQPNDTLQAIADIYGIDVNTLIAANPGIQPYYLTIGQSIQIPVPVPGEPGSSLKLIPDSELVASPYTIGFAVSPLFSPKMVT